MWGGRLSEEVEDRFNMLFMTTTEALCLWIVPRLTRS